MRAPKPMFTRPEFFVGVSRLQWPKHWQLCIYKIEKLYSKIEGKDQYMVWPLNPEPAPEVNLWAENMDQWMAYSPCLPPVSFASLEEVDNWAKIAARIEESYE